MRSAAEVAQLERELAKYKALAKAKGPRLGVAKQATVRTAGGRVGQWWTPTWLARELARWAGVTPGMRVLDAGAGRGALSYAAAELGADVVALEADRRLADRLVTEDDGRLAGIAHRDFLEEGCRRQMLIPGSDARPWPLVLSNPPWEGILVEQFLARACEVGERACFIVPLNLVCGGKRSTFWRGAPIVPTRGRALPVRPKFLGTNGGMRDVMLLEVVPRSRANGEAVRFEMEIG